MVDLDLALCRKIRLQVQGELGGIKRGALHIVKELGVFGLYRGATACLLRFVIFLQLLEPHSRCMQRYSFFSGKE